MERQTWTWDPQNNAPCEWNLPEFARLDGKPISLPAAAMLANAWLSWELGESDDTASGTLEKIEAADDVVHLTIRYPDHVGHLWHGPGAAVAAAHFHIEMNL